MIRHLLVAALLIAVSDLQAQVRVVESSPQSVRSGVAQPIDKLNAQTAAYFELQSLKEEISQLRGLVEEQAHELSRLKQQQMDNYLDLDKRIATLSGSVRPIDAGPSGMSAEPLPSSSTSLRSSGADLSNLGEAELYAAAYDLLKQRQIDSSVSAFKEYLSRFPSGAYAGNSYYWLGEIFLLKNELPQSRDWFVQLIEKFPDDRKVSDAKFKLGKVYHLLGESPRSKALLTEVAAGAGDSARLAQQYLKENF